MCSQPSRWRFTIPIADYIRLKANVGERTIRAELVGNTIYLECYSVSDAIVLYLLWGTAGCECEA